MSIDVRSLTYSYYIKGRTPKLIPSHLKGGKILEIGAM
jgi:hypothetical protein